MPRYFGFTYETKSQELKFIANSDGGAVIRLKATTDSTQQISLSPRTAEALARELMSWAIAKQTDMPETPKVIPEGAK